MSNFTFLRGASHPRELVEQAMAQGYSALALTDECSMAGAVRAYEATKDTGFKLIIGSEFNTTDGLQIVLLAPTQKAYAQICALITLGRRRSTKGSYQLTRTDFETGLDDCLGLLIPPSKPTISHAIWVKELFAHRGWLTVELHRNAGDAKRLANLRALAEKLDLPMVATGDVHMHVRERRALQDTVTAIRHGCTVEKAGYRLFSNSERHLRSYAELQAIYPRHLLDETLRIAERCEFSLGSLKYNYPHELVPSGMSAIRYLRRLV
ncbi:MAG: PHP domain-containing protein, partial [Candidatus Obscuribacterales bacterium]|nr:PHP domain-containing protein [Steroidobacteraceae bacterium]